jgi:hypothetical protein
MFDEASFDLIDEFLRRNRNSPNLQESRKNFLNKKPDLDFTIRDDLFLYQERLVVPDEKNLRTRLIKEVYDQILIIYFGRNKIHRLLRLRYYWHGILADIERYIKNYYSCYRTDILRNKIFGFFYFLPVPDRSW